MPSSCPSGDLVHIAKSLSVAHIVCGSVTRAPDISAQSHLPRVLIADDHRLVAFGLAAAFGDDFDIVDVVLALSAVEQSVASALPDVVLLDLVFGPQCALPLVPRLRAVKCHPAVIILTAHAEPALAAASIEAGASGYVLKSCSAVELRHAVSEALAGRTYVSDLSQRPSASEEAAAVQVRISNKERQLLSSLSDGADRCAVGVELGISRKGVEYHLDRLRHTLGLRRTSQLVRWFRQWG